VARGGEDSVAQLRQSHDADRDLVGQGAERALLLAREKTEVSRTACTPPGPTA
jgi:hypothetical protein